MSELNKADLIYKELIEDIYKNGVWDKEENVRTMYADGESAYTKSIFGKQVVFEEGEIPLLTTKHVGWKTAFKEMRLFWLLQSVKQEDFERENVKVWNEWFKNGSLGKSYAYQFESRPSKEVVVVDRRLKEKDNYKSENIQVSELQSSNPKPTRNGKYVGNTYKTKDYGEYVVLDSYISKSHNNPRALIQFLNTGYIKELDIAGIMRGENIIDIYHRSFFGIGYLGNKERFNSYYSTEILTTLYSRWYYMLQRCYKDGSTNYKNYGNKGVFVCERWHSFENYIEDMTLIPNFFIAKQDNFIGYDLDKDYYGSNCYSRDTCVWLKSGENVAYRNSPITINLILPNGDKELFLSIADAEKKYNLSNLTKVFHGERKAVRGYKVEAVKNLNPNKLYRYKISNNQVVDLLHNIKNSPMSRRLMTSFWNDTDVKDKVLQECAMQTTWNVRNGKLDLLLYSRSVDTALGLPFNWIQYWFLLQLVAKSTGLKAGRFIHQMGNVHYYDRHEDVLLEQINSPINNKPDFKFTTNNKNFFSFVLNDISVENYNNNGKFNYEVAI